MIFAQICPCRTSLLQRFLYTPKTVHLLLGLSFRNNPSVGDVKNSVSLCWDQMLSPVCNNRLSHSNPIWNHEHNPLWYFFARRNINLWHWVNCFFSSLAWTSAWFLPRSKDRQKRFAVAQILISRLRSTCNLSPLALVIVIFSSFDACPLLCLLKWEWFLFLFNKVISETWQC